jgi:hypothetical protein
MTTREKTKINVLSTEQFITPMLKILKYIRPEWYEGGYYFTIGCAMQLLDCIKSRQEVSDTMQSETAKQEAMSLVPFITSLNSIQNTQLDNEAVCRPISHILSNFSVAPISLDFNCDKYPFQTRLFIERSYLRKSNAENAFAYQNISIVVNDRREMLRVLMIMYFDACNIESCNFYSQKIYEIFDIAILL